MLIYEHPSANEQPLRGKCPTCPLCGTYPKGKGSLISRSPAAPYEISSLATPRGAARFKPAALSLVIPHPCGEHSGRATKRRLFYVQYKSQLAPGSEVLCRTSAFREGSMLQRQLRFLGSESNISRYAATHPPEGKATHCILSRLRLLANAVRCAPLTQSPLPCERGRVYFCSKSAGRLDLGLGLGLRGLRPLPTTKTPEFSLPLHGWAWSAVFRGWAGRVP